MSSAAQEPAVDMHLLPWIVAIAMLGLLATVMSAWLLKSAPQRAAELPTEWALSPRSVFSLDERRVYRLLREALPHHVILAKLPLVRFCQAIDAVSGRYWYDLLGAAHVTFAVCSPNGRVLAAIDLDSERPPSKRVMRVKQSVLAACRVRYLRCPVDRPPSIAELQLLVPSGAAAMRGPHPSPGVGGRRASRAGEGGASRDERASLWEDSIAFQDSFFSPDSRNGGFGPSEWMPPLSATGSGRWPDAEPDAAPGREAAPADRTPPTGRPPRVSPTPPPWRH